MADYIHEGKLIDYTPVADVTAGDVIVLGDLIAIAKLDIEAGRLGALAVDGVFDVAKATGVGEALTTGTKVYWDDGNKVVTDADGGGANKYFGKVVADAGDDDASVRVRLEQ